MCRKNSINNLVADVRKIIEIGRGQAYAAASYAAITTYWSVGRRIVEEEQGGQARADYGKGIIKNLAEALVPVYGNSYSKRNLDYYKKFYLLFPDLQIVNTRVHNLEWTHVRRVLSVTNPEARRWYLSTASEHKIQRITQLSEVKNAQPQSPERAFRPQAGVQPP